MVESWIRSPGEDIGSAREGRINISADEGSGLIECIDKSVAGNGRHIASLQLRVNVDREVVVASAAGSQGRIASVDQSGDAVGRARASWGLLALADTEITKVECLTTVACNTSTCERHGVGERIPQ